ncbi:hypothetical protein VM98_36470, partial [Streptomyces rubellomurinus subsp. indigoferus]
MIRWAGVDGTERPGENPAEAAGRRDAEQGGALAREAQGRRKVRRVRVVVDARAAGQAGRRGALEQRAGRRLDAERRAGPGGRGGAQRRGAAQVEEAVLDADRGQAQN